MHGVGVRDAEHHSFDVIMQTVIGPQRELDGNILLRQSMEHAELEHFVCFQLVVEQREELALKRVVGILCDIKHRQRQFDEHVVETAHVLSVSVVQVVLILVAQQVVQLHQIRDIAVHSAVSTAMRMLSMCMCLMLCVLSMRFALLRRR